VRGGNRVTAEQAGGNHRHIAIIGMSARIPGAVSLDEFWANLCDGVCSVRRFGSGELPDPA
jgi:acyl transferase domain-containing protein